MKKKARHGLPSALMARARWTIEYRRRTSHAAFTPSSSRPRHDESVIDKKKDAISEKAKREIIEQVIRPVIPKKLWKR